MSPLFGRRKPMSLLNTAAAWALAQQEGLSKRERSRLDAWLAESPRHEEAYQAARVTLLELDRHAAHRDIMALRQAALAAHPDPRASARSVASWAAAAMVIVLIGGVLGWATWKRSTIVPATAYTTAVGERSTVPLADGSIVTLNTASVIEVAYEAQERKIFLLQGQALFAVAHGQPAPFRVYAGDKVITAVGTVFDVCIEGDRVRVSVVEGAVRVGPRTRARVHSPAAEGETLSAGQALMASPDGAVSVKQIDVERLASWRSGLLSFEDTPLSEAIAEVNRYTHRPLSLADPRLGQYRVSGTFRVGEPERFAEAMTQLFPLALESRGAGTVIKAK